MEHDILGILHRCRHTYETYSYEEAAESGAALNLLVAFSTAPVRPVTAENDLSKVSRTGGFLTGGGLVITERTCSCCGARQVMTVLSCVQLECSSMPLSAFHLNPAQ